MLLHAKVCSRTFLRIIISCLFVTLGFGVPVAAQTPTWSSDDIGNPVNVGTMNVVSGVTRIEAAGGGLDDAADHCYFAHRSLTGDVDLTVRLDDPGSLPRAQAGLVLRDSLDPTARSVALLFSPIGGLTLLVRAESGGAPDTIVQLGSATPIWLKLARRGRGIDAGYSADGVNWTPIGHVAIDLPATVLGGIAVASGSDSEAVTASFGNLEAVLVGADLPEPWQSRDVGDPRLIGDAAIVGHSVVVRGAGNGIRGKADRFHYLYQPAVGDFDVRAHVDALTGPRDGSVAGLMIRNTMDWSSPHAAMLASAGRGWHFRRRRAVSAATQDTRRRGTAPGWVRLVRLGGAIDAFISVDGASWTLVGSDRVDLADHVLVGLVVASAAPSLAEATFSGVAFAGASSENGSLAVAMTGPAPGATFDLPAAVPLTAIAAAPSSSIARVDFYVDAGLIGSSSVPPYRVTWTASAPGDYQLRAVAIDRAGAAAASDDVVVTIRDGQSIPLNPPIRVAFTPSPDHDTLVEYYELEIRDSGAAVTSRPIGTKQLGLPPVVSGRIEVDISDVYIALPAGGYFAVVKAHGAGGNAASGPSLTFTRSP